MSEVPMSKERLEKGHEVLTRVYGKQTADYVSSAAGTPYTDETIGRLFGEVWDRPGLSLRDRRLLVLGATAMLGREDLVAFQVGGGIQGGDFDKAQLDEIIFQLAYYVGWGNASALTKGVGAALAAAEAAKSDA